MRYQITNLLMVAVLLCAVGCGGKESSDKKLSGSEAAVLPEQCPERFTAVLHTTKGDIRIDVNRADAPLGAARFYELVKSGYYTDVAFFRVIEGFMAQAGIHGSPEVNTQWREKKIADDKVVKGNSRGAVSFAMGGPGTRTTQFFINFKDNPQLDGMGFAAFGTVADMAVVDALFAGYGEGAPSGQGPSQMFVQTKGNPYLKANFPNLDYIVSASISL